MRGYKPLRFRWCQALLGWSSAFVDTFRIPFEVGLYIFLRNNWLVGILFSRKVLRTHCNHHSVWEIESSFSVHKGYVEKAPVNHGINSPVLLIRFEMPSQKHDTSKYLWILLRWSTIHYIHFNSCTAYCTFCIDFWWSPDLLKPSPLEHFRVLSDPVGKQKRITTNKLRDGQKKNDQS